jgi:hypothetical protein
MSRMAGDVDDETTGSVRGGTVDPIDAYFDGIDERVERLAESLKPRFEALEADRLRVRGYITKIVIVVAIPIVLFFISGLLQAPLMPHYETSPIAKLLLDYWMVLLGVVAALALLVIAVKFVMPGLAAHLEYRRKFKQTIASEVFKVVVPDGTYQPDHHISQKALDESGLFSGRYAKFRGDDLIRGRVGDIEFEASELHAMGQFTSNRRKESQHTSSVPNVTEFHGQVFHFGLPGSINGHTIVEPEHCEGRIFNHRKGFETIAFEGDDAWTENFRVYTTDATEARRLLTPRVRKALLRLYENYFTSVPFLSFIRNHAYVAVHSGRNSLEPTIAKPAGYAEVSSFAEFFGKPALLVRELELDGSRGGASFAARTSILAEKPTAAFGTLDLNKPITTGALTEGIFDDPDDQDAARTPPANTSVKLSPATGEGFEATYAISPVFYLRILWTLALLPFIAAGFARLAGASGAVLHAAIAERVPQVTIVSDWALQYPFAFVPLALLFYVLPSWTMTQIPRGVSVNRDGLTIRKRLWPIPRKIAMDRIAGVKVNDRQVLIQRTKTAFLRRWVNGAPMLGTTEEAKWLAAHLRRALKMFGGLRG